MAAAGACFIFVPGCLRFVWRTFCKSDLSADGHSRRSTPFDSTPQRNARPLSHADGYAYCDANSGRDIDSHLDVYQNPDSESDADRDGHPALNQDTLLDPDRNSHETSLTHGKIRHSRYPGCPDPGGATGHRCAIEYAHKDENSYAGSFPYTNDHTDFYCLAHRDT